MSHIKKYLPKSSIVLFSLDSFCVLGLQAIFFKDYYEKLSLYSYLQAFSIIFIAAALQIMLLYSVGCYRRDTLLNPTLEISQVPVAGVLSGILIFLTLHVGYAAIYPTVGVYQRGGECAIITLVIAGVSLGASVISRIAFRIMQRLHWFGRRIVIIGTGKRAEHLKMLLSIGGADKSTELTFLPAAVLADMERQGEHAETGSGEVVPDLVHGQNRSLDDVIDEGVDEIVVAADERRGLSLNPLLKYKATGIPVTDYATFIERETGRVDLQWVEDSWLVYSDGFKMRPIDISVKRAFDILTSGIILLISLPILFIAAMVLVIDSGFPIFYMQDRVTKGGRHFKLIKLRTMRADAEKDGPRWASKVDNRVTRIGNFLRKVRIDELPQLFNIFRGDMSLVGPRPERPFFTTEFAKNIRLYDLRHSVAAGLTGWAQINYPYGASSEDARRKLEYDLYYIKNYHIFQDARILLQTIRIVLWMDGAR